MRVRRVASLLMALLLLLGGGEPGAAQSPGALGVRLITPPDHPARSFFHYVLAPGKSASDEVEIKNSGTQPMEVRVYGGDCWNDADGVLNGPLFGQPSKAAGRWLGLSPTPIKLAPRQTARVRFKVEVPVDVAPGDHFALLLFEPVSGEPPSTVPSAKDRAEFRMRLVQRMGITVWVRAPGPLTRGLRVTGMRKAVEDGVLMLRADIENTGNTYLKPWRRWTLRSSAGTLVASEERASPGYLLPGSPQRLRAPIGVTRPLARGEYIFEIVVEYDDRQVTERATVTLP